MHRLCTDAPSRSSTGRSSRFDRPYRDHRSGSREGRFICRASPGMTQVGEPYETGSGSQLRSSTTPLGLHSSVWDSATQDPPLLVTSRRGLNVLLSGTTESSAELSRDRLDVIVGSYAQKRYVPDSPESVTATVARWADYLPTKIVLPHPSPRNRGWLTSNPWFEAETLPAVRDTRTASPFEAARPEICVSPGTGRWPTVRRAEGAREHLLNRP